MATVRDLPALVASEYGPYAEIVAAERVTVGGVRGLLRKEHFEVTVVVPDAPRTGAHVFPESGRAGIEALLDDADAAEARVHAREAVAPAPPVSTSSAAFDTLLDTLLTRRAEPPPVEGGTRDAEPDAAASDPRHPGAAADLRPPVAPAVLRNPGDLVLVVGLDDEPKRMATRFSAATGATLAVAGDLRGAGLPQIQDRRAAMAARSAGVQSGAAIVVAVGLGGGRTGVEEIVRMLAGTSPDQVWVVVDARRKTDDTLAWVDAVRAVLPIAGVGVVGAEDTRTPESVDLLGLPVRPGRHAVS